MVAAVRLSCPEQGRQWPEGASSLHGLDCSMTGHSPERQWHHVPRMAGPSGQGESSAQHMLVVSAWWLCVPRAAHMCGMCMYVSHGSVSEGSRNPSWVVPPCLRTELAVGSSRHVCSGCGPFLSLSLSLFWPFSGEH